MALPDLNEHISLGDMLKNYNQARHVIMASMINAANLLTNIINNQICAENASTEEKNALLDFKADCENFINKNFKQETEATLA